MAVTAAPTDAARVEAAVDALLADCDAKTMPAEDFWGARFDRGLAWVSFPEGHGGLAVAPPLQAVVDQALTDAGAPDNFPRNPIGLGMGAPVVLAHGSPAQKERYLRPLFTCEEIWCQMFSEPGAGSDVAGLSTRAIRDGEEWIVNGQKVWTTLAHKSRYGMLVARTDPDAVKHKGLTYFVVDMHAPGVEVRPLRQMTGDAEFNEIYFTDARIPDSERLGDVGDGWRVVLTTLMNERMAIGASAPEEERGAIREALAIWNARDDAGRADLVARDRLVAAWVDSEVLRLTTMRAVKVREAGTPGPEGSVVKALASELNQRIYELCIDLLGPEGALYWSYEMRRPDEINENRDIHQTFLRSRANTIEGGTSEIMRNILGERVLGLQGEPRTDRDLPWNEVPRN
ncbi:MAG: acyl-CoA dehydrogenase family protein [Acidimicrobiia bacterium]